MLRLLLFGGLSVSNGSTSLGGAAGQHRALALLALLASAGERGISRDRLIAYLWPESEAEAARHTLRQWLTLLRRDLCDADVIVGNAELRLNASRISSDVAEFDNALERNEFEQAAKLYAGPFLDGFYLNDASEFQCWAEEERSRRRTQLLDAVETLAIRCDELHDIRRAAQWWQRLATLDPLSSRIAVGYMESLCRAGDRTRALEFARVHETLVREELGAEADPAVRRLTEHLRRTSVAGITGPSAAPSPLDGTLDVSTETPAPLRRGGAASRVAGRRVVQITLAVFALGLAALGVRAIRHRVLGSSIEHRPVLVAALENRTGDAAFEYVGPIMADWIAEGVRQTELMEVVDPMIVLGTRRAAGFEPGTVSRPDAEELATRTHAGLVVRGSYRSSGDTLMYEIEVDEAGNPKPVRVLEVVRTPQRSPLEGAIPLREEVLSALTSNLGAGRAPISARTGEPLPRRDAYEEYVRGLEEFWRDGGAALAHFRRAVALDSSFARSLIWAAENRLIASDLLAADSLLYQASRSRDHLSRYDGFVLDALRAEIRGDQRAAYEARLLALTIAPTSPIALRRAAELALNANHPRQAAELLSRLDPELYWCGDCDHYWWNLTSAEHMMGDYRRELADAQRAERQYPGRLPILADEIRALAALGRVEEVERSLDAALTSHSEGWFNHLTLMDMAADELAVHGQLAGAQRVRARAMAWYAAQPAQLKRAGALDFSYAWLLGKLGRHREAEVVFERVLARDPESQFYAGYAATEAMRAGDPRMADSLAAVLEHVSTLHNYGRAAWWLAHYYALRGEREAAVTHLRDAFAQGYEFNIYIHLDPELELLRGYAPFDEFMRPHG